MQKAVVGKEFIHPKTDSIVATVLLDSGLFAPASIAGLKMMVSL
jgi:hypothetical protein